MKPDEFFNLLSSSPPGLSSKSEFQLLIDDMKKYITTNVDFHQGNLLAHSAWTAFYVSELFDIKTTKTSPLQRLYYDQLVKDFEDEGLYSIDVKKVLILAAFLHDIGKAGDGVTTYNDKDKHEKTGALYLFDNNYKTVVGKKIDLNRILKDYKISDLEKDIIICLVAGHWLIGDTMTSGVVNEEEYFVSEFISIVHNFITDSDLQENIPFIVLMCMMQLIICVADVLASQEYKGSLKSIKDFPDIPLEHATHKGMNAYNKFNYDDIIDNFVPKVFTLIEDGYFIQGNNGKPTVYLVDELINNAASISPEDFTEAIGTIVDNGDYNIDQITDIIFKFINIGDFKRVYIILDKFPNFVSELFNVIEINKGISSFIRYILTISSKQQLNTIIRDIIYTHKINFIKELIKVNYKFTPYFLGIARNSYGKAKNIIDESTAYDMFDLIKSSYNFSDYYINDKHKIFCETLIPTLDTVPEALQITTTRVLIPFDKLLEDNFTPDFLDSFPSVKQGTVDITYEKDNYGGGLENTVDVEKGYMFHNDWIIQSTNYIKGLSYEDIFTIYGYSHNGDELSNKYIIGNNQSYLDFVNSHIYDGYAQDRYSTKYFPLFFQVLDLIKKYNKTKLTIPGEDPSFISNIKKTNSTKNKYILLINNLEKINLGIIKSATDQYIKDLDRIIKNGPPLSHDVLLYRGVKDKYYYPDPNNKIFVNNTFMSTSYTIFNAYSFANTECCVKKIFCKAGTPAIFLECITSHPTENEILLGLNNKFEILKDEVRNNFEVQSKFSDICEVVKGKMNVTTMVTV